MVFLCPSPNTGSVFLFDYVAKETFALNRLM